MVSVPPPGSGISDADAHPGPQKKAAQTRPEHDCPWALTRMKATSTAMKIRILFRSPIDGCKGYQILSSYPIAISGRHLPPIQFQGKEFD
jgi:hypothetical protein